ncbi:hypothetical protein [Peptacetobacter sp.]|uniref:hypothetical protein n=1 Tax=Peptacetobacter sp. TaxID=2991975 RepID=UPI0026062AF9|nr:hypothetical protein [Peptacetobacter sp.]
MNIENFTKETLESLQKELSSTIESIRKIKFNGNTLYIVIDKEEISPEIIDIMKTYIITKSGISYGINIVFLNESDLIDLGLRKIAEIQMSKNFSEDDKEEKESTIEVKRPDEESSKSEEKEEYKEEADINRIDAMDVWKVMLGRIQELISPAVYKALFKDSKQIDYKMGIVYILVGDTRVVQIMETQYLRFLQDVSEDLFGIRLSFRFVVDEKENINKNDEEVYPASMNDLNDFFTFLNNIYNK